MQNVETQERKIQTSDGVSLAGTIYRGENPTIAILLSAGTGFPQQFYRNAARHLAGKGAVVLTYDYRGIGGSAPDDLANSSIDYPDWGRFDQPAALDCLADQAPDLPIMHLAHSVGGHFIGLMPNHGAIKRHAFVSVGTGYFGHHHKSYRMTEMYFWWGIGTISLAIYGYVKPILGWRGGALPPKLFKTWRRWSHRKAYFSSEYNSLMNPQHYADVTAPMQTWVFSDDPVATEKSSAAILACYSNAPHKILRRSPSDYDQSHIGHDGAFRKGREKIWDECWDWFVE
ncbi:alpha/beta hydrolase [Amylibacter kogurei]|uniref:Alpha/beta hydrolase n=2 Tax=Paramylibacter kogurei TaxID=1889778 RepID=A0A2G5K1Z0_9RHOB|nr:alpha/beta hydrolase [Amylibacter kogurei]